MILPLEEFRLALGERGSKLSDAELRVAHLEAEALARILFDVLVPPRRDAREEERAA